MILHQNGEVVGPLEADGSQEVRDSIGARLQLSVGDRLARQAMMIAGWRGSAVRSRSIVPPSCCFSFDALCLAPCFSVAHAVEALFDGGDARYNNRQKL
jgi:hypothetical protein